METPTPEEVAAVQVKFKSALLQNAEGCDTIADAGERVCKLFQSSALQRLQRAQSVPPGQDAHKWEAAQQDLADGYLSYAEGLIEFNQSLRDGAANSRLLAEML